MKKIRQNKGLHLFFEISILLKGFHALLEIISGLAIFLTPRATIISFLTFLAGEEISEDSKDLISNFLLKTAGELSVSSQHFIAIYLLSHGIIKLFVILSLIKRRRFAYPTAIIVFSLFIIYQLHRYTFTHSPWLLVISALDFIVILLTMSEYRYIKSRNSFRE